jgi:spore maturation protein SpmB
MWCQQAELSSTCVACTVRPSVARRAAVIAVLMESGALMYMRDLACCANGMAFYSTPSDLVRFALATNRGSINGELAGGMVMSLIMERNSGIVIAVTSNMAHANTPSLALRVGEAFAEQTR